MSDEHNIRAIAILILDEILQKNYSRDVVLARYFSKYELSEIDRDFIFNVVLNTLRFKEIFDEIITKVLNIRLQRIEPLI
ncbi:MAG: transcription antitermination factor NusB, partial [Myxococcota bacterium]